MQDGGEKSLIRAEVIGPQHPMSLGVGRMHSPFVNLNKEVSVEQWPVGRFRLGASYGYEGWKI